MKFILKTLLVVSFFAFSGSAFGQYATNIKPKGFGSWGCFGSAIGEFLIPGLGYAINEQFDKMAIFGGSRWVAQIATINAINDENFLRADDRLKTIDKEDSANDRRELHLYYNPPNVTAEFASTYNLNIGFLGIYDFYTYGCAPNTGTYYRMADPVNFLHLWKKWYFWAFILGGVALRNNADEKDTNLITYYLGDGLTRSELRKLSYQHYFVGIGEETFFRGVVQSSFYDLYQNLGLSKTVSRYSGIVSAATIFGLSHAGIGTQSSASAAFFFGLLLGLMYQPDNDTFDITTPAATHSWNNFLVSEYFFDNATYVETEEPVRGPDFAVPIFMRY